MERRGFLTRLAGAAALTTIGAAVGTSSASAAVAQSTPVGAIPTWMYVQTGRSGSWRRKGSGYELTIEGVAPNIVAFTDRPSRNVQTQSLKTWLSKFPILGKKNPPNAAVVVPDGKGGEKTLIVELTKGAYDPTKQRATWLVRPLREQVTGHKAGVAKRLGIDVRDYSVDRRLPAYVDKQGHVDGQRPRSAVLLDHSELRLAERIERWAANGDDDPRLLALPDVEGVAAHPHNAADSERSAWIVQRLD